MLLPSETPDAPESLPHGARLQAHVKFNPHKNFRACTDQISIAAAEICMVLSQGEDLAFLGQRGIAREMTNDLCPRGIRVEQIGA